MAVSGTGCCSTTPSLHLPPRLTWCFNFPFKDVSREDDSPLSLNVEWLPVPAESWRRLAGHHLTSARFGEPTEASICHYLHHRFDSLDLDLVEQRGHLLRAVATVSGDIDRLGVDPVRADAWLRSPAYSSRSATRSHPMSPWPGSVSSPTRTAWRSTPTVQTRRCDSSHYRTDARPCGRIRGPAQSRPLRPRSVRVLVAIRSSILAQFSGDGALDRVCLGRCGFRRPVRGSPHAGGSGLTERAGAR